VSEQNLLPDNTGDPIEHPGIEDFFASHDGERYVVPSSHRN
jgi:heat shock protein HspQ